MLIIIFACVIALFLIFALVSFFMLMKNITLTVDNQTFRIRNLGSKLNIFINDKLVIKSQSPNLTDGVEYKIKHEDAEYLVKCRSNKFGNILRVEIFRDGVRLADNGKIIKENTTKKKVSK